MERQKSLIFSPGLWKGGELLDPLQETKYFKKVKMDKLNYTITWPNGADFCPDVLYESGMEVAPPKKRTHAIRRTPSTIQEKNRRGE